MVYKKIIRQCYNAYGESTDTYVMPDPKDQRECIREVHDNPERGQDYEGHVSHPLTQDQEHRA